MSDSGLIGILTSKKMENEEKIYWIYTNNILKDYNTRMIAEILEREEVDNEIKIHLLYAYLLENGEMEDERRWAKGSGCRWSGDQFLASACTCEIEDFTRIVKCASDRKKMMEVIENALEELPNNNRWMDFFTRDMIETKLSELWAMMVENEEEVERMLSNKKIDNGIRLSLMLEILIGVGAEKEIDPYFGWGEDENEIRPGTRTYDRMMGAIRKGLRKKTNAKSGERRCSVDQSEKGTPNRKKPTSMGRVIRLERGGRRNREKTLKNNNQ